MNSNPKFFIIWDGLLVTVRFLAIYFGFDYRQIWEYPYATYELFLMRGEQKNTPAIGKIWIGERGIEVEFAVAIAEILRAKGMPVANSSELASLVGFALGEFSTEFTDQGFTILQGGESR